MDGQQSFDQYRMLNELWERLEPLLPQYERRVKGGRQCGRVVLTWKILFDTTVN